MNIIIATIKEWHIENAKRFQETYAGSYNVELITNPKELTEQWVMKTNPDWVFFPHWSWKIPASIYLAYRCVVFHITDLPYGRGGSPLQNLIVRGHQETKISAIRVVEEMDAGPIYLKKPLSLLGTAEEIFRRASYIIFQEMIPMIIQNPIIPKEQEGAPTYFKRRTQAQSSIEECQTLDKLYDHIRMLDGEGYPPAFLETEEFIFEFTRASLKTGFIQADVKIKKKTEQEGERM